jgi:hypothetical protein
MRMTTGIGSKLSLAALVASAAMFAPPAARAVDAAPVRILLQPRIMLSQGEYARLQAAADKGSEALRRYIWRTRIIYNYYLPDLLPVRD